MLMNKKNGAKIPPPLEGNDGAALQWKMRNISHARMHVVTDMLSEYGLHYTYPRILGTILYREGATQKELAELVCVAQSTIAIWESGNNYPRADKLPELARVLGCSISDLYGSEQKGA